MLSESVDKEETGTSVHVFGYKPFRYSPCVNVVLKVAKTRVFHSEFVKTQERKFFETTSFAKLGGYRKLAACEYYHELSGAVHPHL
jgi:hypothetical protein